MNKFELWEVTGEGRREKGKDGRMGVEKNAELNINRKLKQRKKDLARYPSITVLVVGFQKKGKVRDIPCSQY